MLGASKLPKITCPEAVWDVDTCVTVILVMVRGGERAAGRDVGDGEGMGQSGDVFVPVLL